MKTSQVLNGAIVKWMGGDGGFRNGDIAKISDATRAYCTITKTKSFSKKYSYPQSNDWDIEYIARSCILIKAGIPKKPRKPRPKKIHIYSPILETKFYDVRVRCYAGGGD